ncbi:hypothetical protein [Baekduia sp. Peel2402]|uniref:hypothetical protein n=1 Tax=Baekduia sp. Peel2402 TaxID=3458296 RepID=UPI00403E4E6B
MPVTIAPPPPSVTLLEVADPPFVLPVTVADPVEAVCVLLLETDVDRRRRRQRRNRASQVTRSLAASRRQARGELVWHRLRRQRQRWWYRRFGARRFGLGLTQESLSYRIPDMLIVQI